MPMHLAYCPVCHQLYDTTQPTPLSGRCARCVPRPIQEHWTAEHLIMASLQGLQDLIIYLDDIPHIPRKRWTKPARAAVKELFQAATQVRKDPNAYPDIMAQKLGFPHADALCAYPDAVLLLWDRFWGPDGQRFRRLRMLREPWRLFWGSDYVVWEPYRPPVRLNYEGRPPHHPWATPQDVIRYRRIRLKQERWMQPAYRVSIPQWEPSLEAP